MCFWGLHRSPSFAYTSHVDFRCHPIQGQPKVWKMHFCRYGPFEFDPGHSRLGSPKKTGCAKIPCENTTAFLEQIFIVSHMFCHMVDPGVAVSQVRLEAFYGVSRSILKMLPFWDGLVEISLHQLDLLQCLNWELVVGQNRSCVLPYTP